MTAHIKFGGTYRNVTPYIKFSGTHRPAVVYIKFGGTYRFVAGAQVTLTPSSINQGGSGATVLSNVVISNITGGIGPFTYSWAPVSAGGIVMALSPTGGSQQFQANGMASGEVRNGVYRLSVTDTANGQVFFADISVRLFRT